MTTLKPYLLLRLDNCSLKATQLKFLVDTYFYSFEAKFLLFHTFMMKKHIIFLLFLSKLL